MPDQVMKAFVDRFEATGIGDAEPFDPDFGRQVRDALLHLNDWVYLQTHPLAAHLSRAPEGQHRNRGKALSNVMVSAIDGFRPDVTVGRRGERSHRLLYLRYVEALSPTDVQADLGIGETEYYRAQRRAVQAVVSDLAARFGVATTSPDGVSADEPAERPAERLTDVASAFGCPVIRIGGAARSPRPTRRHPVSEIGRRAGTGLPAGWPGAPARRR